MSDREYEAAEGRAVSHDHADDLQFLIHHAELPETGISRAIDGALVRLGRSISWAWIALMAVIVINVVMKNLFGEGRVEFEEIQWHIYAALFMLGLSVTLVTDDHVRVDLLYGGFTLRIKAWIDLVGIVCLLMPFVIMLLWYGVPFVADAVATGERSSSPAGLPLRWIIKSALVLGIGLLGLAACSRLTRIVALLFLGHAPAAKKAEA